MSQQAWDDHRLEQLRRAAAWPLWQRLQWLEEALRVAEHLHKSPPVSPPSWARQESAPPPTSKDP
ncbi:MAG: hypothetical protein EA401_06935 [Planctomycetota bacterium]|nr:MAG: hypothetical protein EA401_06935 [Planctomycetota bacterium]